MKSLIPGAALALLSLGGAFAQNQQPVSFARDYCVKVTNGKWAEYAGYVHDVTAKLMQARLDSGDIAWGAVTRVITPAGTSARCDYHIVYGYGNKLPEPNAPGTTDAALKRAGLNMTASEMTARRDSLSRLVSLEVLRTVESVPLASVTKGSYVRANHYKVRSGQPVSAWVEIERDTWKPLVVADNAAGHKSGWLAYVVMMPQGDSTWSNAMTVDLFPDWESLMRGIPLNELWPKVHGNRSRAEWSDRLNTIRERPLVEIANVVEFSAPKSAAAGGNN
jgi:hypothetical protein